MGFRHGEYSAWEEEDCGCWLLLGDAKDMALDEGRIVVVKGYAKEC